MPSEIAPAIEGLDKQNTPMLKKAGRSGATLRPLCSTTAEHFSHPVGNVHELVAFGEVIDGVEQ